MRYLWMLVLVTAMFVPAGAFAQATTGSAAVLVHVTQKPREGQAGFAVWVIMPNLVHRWEKQLVVFGPRFEGEGWWIEPMVGTFLDPGADSPVRPLVDIRGNLKSGRWSAFSILQVVRPEGGPDIAPYLEVNYNLTQKVLVGLETDNEFLPGPDTVSLGAHVGVAADDHLFVMAAFQKHRFGDDQFWIRLVWSVGKK